MGLPPAGAPALAAICLILAWQACTGAEIDVDATAAAGIAAYSEQVARLQADGGPYDPLLAEALAGLGRAQLAAGMHAAAAKTLERALHVARVNEGLHNPAHLPLMEQLLEVHAALGDAGAVDRDYQQIYWVRARNAGTDRAALLPVIAEIGRGRLRAYESAPAATGLEHLVKADALFDLARRIEAETGNDSGTALLYGAALANQRLALEMRGSRVGFHDLRAVLIDNGREVFEVNEGQARETLFQECFLKGEWAAREVVARTAAHAAAKPLAHAEALRFLGDYYLSFRRNIDAMQEYRRALAVLEQYGLRAHEQRLFGEPAPVTLLRAPGDESGPSTAAGGRFVEALLDVGADGWPANVRVQRTEPPDDDSLARRGARALLARHYRPRFVSGRAQSTADVAARYDFRD